MKTSTRIFSPSPISSTEPQNEMQIAMQQMRWLVPRVNHKTDEIDLNHAK